MDSDFWTTRLAAAKRQFNMQRHHHLSHSNVASHHSSQLDRFNDEDFEVEEETRPDFPCPYCYEEFDIASLCSHLEDEHSGESNASRRRRLRRVAIPHSQALSLLGRDLREAHLQLLLGGRGYRSNNATSLDAGTDPILSSIFLSETEDISKSLMSSVEDNSSKSMVSQLMWKSSFDSSLSREEREKRIKQAAGRAVFIQDVLFSTLLAD